jgi:uncharacterized protein
MKQAFIQKYGPWGVVTGGTRGIGKALAESMASRGLNVVICGTREVKEVAKEIADRFQVQTKAIYADLGDPSQVDRITEACKDLAVGLFCCNHASSHLFPDGKWRHWLDTSEEDLDAMLQINLASGIKLMHRFAEKMRSRKKGGLVIVSSRAAQIGTPYVAHYSASKAFLSTLGATLWWELGQEGIDVTTILPGATKTTAALKFMSEEGKAKLPMMSPESVAETAICSLGKKISVIPGFSNNVQSFILSLLPKRIGMRFLDKVIQRFFSVEKAVNPKD